MSRKAMSLKAKIRNLANDKGLPAQMVLQNYIFERFLDRISKSDYRNKLILKGGILIAALVGIDNRATMDLDVTIKNIPLNYNSISQTITSICSCEINDGFKFSFSGIEKIREDDEYGGYRVKILSRYESIVTPIKIDITTGDVITPNEIRCYYETMFGVDTITMWSYNVETILAEKLETILSRGEFNTRPRDYYDIYILSRTQNFNYQMLINALKATADHRNTTHIFNQVSNRIKEIKESDLLKSVWEKYRKQYSYAENIKYEEVCKTLHELMENFN